MCEELSERVFVMFPSPAHLAEELQADSVFCEFKPSEESSKKIPSTNYS